ncbi:MAG: redox-regulated ATPase YchF [Candidatus Falkowbacteria bacterium]
MSVSIGIVGLPNVGKSTLFKALTKRQVDIANYPFCTIAPNKGIVEVPDERLKKLADFYSSQKIVATVVEFWDVAGLVRGAHKGEGLGNQFLSHIREVDAICQVVRCFQDENIIHVNAKVDPAGDRETIDIELALADLEVVKKHLEKLRAKLKGAKTQEQKETQQTIDLLTNKIVPALEAGKLLQKIGLDYEELESIKYLNLLTAKPMFYALNIDENSLTQNVDLQKIGLKNEIVVPICAKLEADLADLPAEEVAEYLKTMNLQHTGLDNIILKAYELLNLITFLTAGPKETRAWTITKGSTAPEAAGKIHTDFQRGFIAADVVNWKVLLDAGSEPAAKEKGLIKLCGKDYIVQDGDVCVFKFNV